MGLDRQHGMSLDWTLLGLVGALCAIGLLNLYSACLSLDPARHDIPLRQAQWMAVGFLLMVLTAGIDYRWFVRHAYLFYGLTLLLLVFVLAAGTTAKGAQRWISLGGVTLQPSEFAKLALLLVLTRYFDDHRSDTSYRLRELVVPFALLALPFVLILKQPDLGTSLLLVLLFLSLTLLVGVQGKSFLLGVAGTALLAPLAWLVLKDYQRERLLTFFDPERDPLGSGYHVIQSMIAIGSGGWFGKGFLQGTQTQLKFLPEQQTDFVFSVIAEEWGLLGSLCVVGLFATLVLWGIHAARSARDIAGTLLAFGIALLIFWEVGINIGMVLGILPVVGIPLPFLSYGGSAMVSLMAGIGLMMNVSARRFMLQS